MKCKVHPSHDSYVFEILDSHEKQVGTAHVDLKHDIKGEFWHLEDFIIIDESNRDQGYGTTLLNYLRKYLWSIDRLRIRVHPAIGQQAGENLAKNTQCHQQQYTEAELNEMDIKLIEEIKQFGFKNIQEDTSNSLDSEKLKKWYKNRGFSVTHDEKYC